MLNKFYYTFSIFRLSAMSVLPCITMRMHTRSYRSPPDRVDILYYCILQYNILGIYTCFQTRYYYGGTPRVRIPYTVYIYIYRYARLLSLRTLSKRK